MSSPSSGNKLSQNSLDIYSDHYEFKDNKVYPEDKQVLNGQNFDRLSLTMYRIEADRYSSLDWQFAYEKVIRRWTEWLQRINSAAKIVIIGSVPTRLLDLLKLIKVPSKTTVLSIEDYSEWNESKLVWCFWETFTNVVELFLVNTTTGYIAANIKKPKSLDTLNVAKSSESNTDIYTSAQWFLQHEQGDVNDQTFGVIVENETSLLLQNIFGDSKERLSNVRKLILSDVEEHLCNGVSKDVVDKIGELKTQLSSLQTMQFLLFTQMLNQKSETDFKQQLCGDWQASSIVDLVRYRMIITCIKQNA